MGFTLAGPVLEGALVRLVRLVRLEPLEPRHTADLAVAAEQDRSGYGFTRVPGAAEVRGTSKPGMPSAPAGRCLRTRWWTGPPGGRSGSPPTGLRELRFTLGHDSNAVRLTYWLAPDRRIVLLTVFRKTRMREDAEVARAKQVRKLCEAEHHTAHDEFTRDVLKGESS